MVKAKQVKPQGFWRYIGGKTRIMGVPARDLTPSESVLFGDVIRQAGARGDVLYVWDTGAPEAVGEAPEEPEALVVVAEVAAPAYETTITKPYKSKPWAPGGEEQKEDE